MLRMGKVLNSNILAMMITLSASVHFSSVAFAQTPLRCEDLFPPDSLSQENQMKSALATPGRAKKAARKAQDFIVKIADGRQLFTQIIPPASTEKPTLLLIPGVNRGLMADEAPVKELAAKGFGVVSFNFSTQPLSVATLPPGVKPSFAKNEYGLKELSFEIDALMAQLAAQGIKNIVPISLSFSSAVTAQMTSLPFLIETVPMTSLAAKEPKLADAMQSLRAAQMFNPFFGPSITRQTLNNAYRAEWKKQVETMAPHFVLPPERKDEMIEGYTMMSRAIEDFTWENVKNPSDPKRVFIFASGETPSLLKHQLQTYRKIMQRRSDALMYFVMESGHILPIEQPKAFAQIISSVLSDKGQNMSGIVIIQPKEKKTTHITGANALALLDKLIAEIP